MNFQNKSKNQTNHKIALYIRVSTEEQASNPEGSIKSQEQRLRHHIDFKNSDESFGEVTKVFIDRAKSGKDTNRPELQKLLLGIRQNEVSLVLVTELSRLSRSVKDFSDIWELMNQHQCKFMSLRENFDTTTSAGELVMFQMSSIAQFERKQCSERVSANFKARAERGLFNGGSVPYGYKLIPEKRGFLEIDKSESELVKAAFQTFISEGTLSRAGKSLNDRGFTLVKKQKCGGSKPRLGYFTVGNLYSMLTNNAYIGIRSFKVGSEIKTSKACWEPLIAETIFNRTQQLLKNNYRYNKMAFPKRYPFLLSGLLRCHKCKDRLPGKSAHGNGGKIPYYEHSWATKRQAFLNKKIFHCDPHRIQAKKLEPRVWNEVLKILSQKDIAQMLIEKANSIHEKKSNTKEIDKLRIKIKDIEVQIEALVEHLSKIPKNLDPKPIFNQMGKLDDLKLKTQKEFEKLAHDSPVQDTPVAFKDYERFLKNLKMLSHKAESNELKAKIIQKLIHKIEVKKNGFIIHYYVGQNQIRQNEWEIQLNTGTPSKTAIETKKGALGSSSNFFKNYGSNYLTNGGGGGNRTPVSK